MVLEAKWEDRVRSVASQRQEEAMSPPIHPAPLCWLGYSYVTSVVTSDISFHSKSFLNKHDFERKFISK